MPYRMIGVLQSREGKRVHVEPNVFIEKFVSSANKRRDVSFFKHLLQNTLQRIPFQ